MYDILLQHNNNDNGDEECHSIYFIRTYSPLTNPTLVLLQDSTQLIIFEEFFIFPLIR